MRSNYEGTVYWKFDGTLVKVFGRLQTHLGVSEVSRKNKKEGVIIPDDNIT